MPLKFADRIKCRDILKQQLNISDDAAGLWIAQQLTADEAGKIINGESLPWLIRDYAPDGLKRADLWTHYQNEKARAADGIPGPVPAMIDGGKGTPKKKAAEKKTEKKGFIATVIDNFKTNKSNKKDKKK